MITNSDDRVPDILSTFGLRVSPLRFGSGAASPLLLSNNISTESEKSATTATNTGEPTTGQNQVSNFDIDFTCISYDVGFEKPNREIFAAAEEMAGRVIGRGKRVDTDDWLKIYVGDEFGADVAGALGAGWNAVWIPDMDGGSGGSVVPRESAQVGEDEALGEMVNLDADGVRDMSVGDVFGCDGVVEGDGEGRSESDASAGLGVGRRRAIRCSSLEVLIEWLAASR